MKTLRWNGEKWWVDGRSLWLRTRQWVAWFGGWETVNRDDREHPHRNRWHFRYDFTKRGRNGKQRRAWRDPFPLSLFGHRITLFGWGGHMRLGGKGYLTWTYRREGYAGKSRFCAYVAKDGTPHTAYHWLAGWTSEDALEPPGYRDLEEGE